ncbi:MAG TPA: glycoside hydrolase family 88 protein [Chitinophagaceae bacterium]
MKSLLLALSFLYAISLSAQTKNSPEELLRRVADNVIRNSSFRFVNTKTGSSTEGTAGLDTSINVKAESKFNKWQYVNGVLTVGMLRIAGTLADAKYAAYSRKNFDFIFNNLDYFKKQYDAGTRGVEFAPVFRIGSLDDCGSMAAGLLDVYAFDKRKEYLDYLQRVGDYIINKQVKFPDGTLARTGPRKMTIWADDLYMSVPFLARMGKLTGDTKYFDFAIRQVENFNRYLYDSATGLFFHCFYNDDNVNGVAHWGRCNGWLAVAQAELLNNLPADHPKRAELIKFLLIQIIGFSRYQDINGMWHQLLDKPDSYAESSVTAMFTYAVAKAVNEGWINRRYISIAQNGWQGLAAKVTDDGQVQDICIGTSIEEDIRYYYTRPAATNDTHGLGPFLMAGSEMIRAKDKLVDMDKRR